MGYGAFDWGVMDAGLSAMLVFEAWLMTVNYLGIVWLGTWVLGTDEPVAGVSVLCLSPLRASFTLFMSPDILAVRCSGYMSIGS